MSPDKCDLMMWRNFVIFCDSRLAFFPLSAHASSCCFALNRWNYCEMMMWRSMMTMSWHKCLYYYIATFHRNATQRCTVHANWTATIWRRSGKITQNSEHQNKLRLSLNTRKRFSANAQKIICSGSESKKRAKFYGKEIIKRKLDRKKFCLQKFRSAKQFFYSRERKSMSSPVTSQFIIIGWQTKGISLNWFCASSDIYDDGFVTCLGPDVV